MSKTSFIIKPELIGGPVNLRIKIIKPPLVDTLQLKSILYQRARAVVI